MDWHAAAVAAGGAAFCWGNGFEGELGIGRFDRARAPTRVKSSLTFRRLSGGFPHTCAEAADNTAWCWGEGIALGRPQIHRGAVPCRCP